MDAPTKKRFIYKPVVNSNSTSAAAPTGKSGNFQFQKNRPNNNPTSFSNNMQRKSGATVSSVRNQKRNLEDVQKQQGNAVGESPAKKMRIPQNNKFCHDDLDFVLDDFDDIEDDDFSKGLTSDDLTLLEADASQAVQKDNQKENNNYSALHQFDKFLSEKTPYSAKLPEISLDLFASTKTESTVSVSGAETSKFDMQHLKKLENDLAQYTTKVKKMEENAFSKDGEIKILRQGLDKAQEERDYYKIQVQKIEGNLKEKQSENEHKLQREIEKLTTQLRFKEKEVREARESRVKSEQRKDSESGLQQHIKKISPKSASSRKMSFDSKNNPFNIKTEKSPSKLIKKEKDIKIKLNTPVAFKDATRISFSLQTALKQWLSFQNWQVRKEFLGDLGKVFKNLQVDDSSSDDDDDDDTENDDSRKERIQEHIYQSIEEIIYISSQTLQIQNVTNIFSVLELIEPNIEEFLSSVKTAASTTGDLLCVEESTSSKTSEINKKKKKKIKLLAGDEIGRVSLLILNIITKHSIDVQESFLLALLENQNGSKSGKAQEKITDLELNQVLKDLSSSVFLKPDDKTDLASYKEECLQIKQSVQYCNKSKFDSSLLVKSLFEFFTTETEDESIKSQISEIIISLASSVSSVSKAGLLDKLCDFPTFISISSNLRKESILALLCVIKNLAIYPRIEELLCRKQGICTLQNLYKVFIHIPGECSKDDWNSIKLEIIQTVSTLVSCDIRMMRFLFESECECSCELVKSLVFMLLKESKEFRESCLDYIEENMLDECKPFLILRQGMSLLSHICMNDRFFLDHRVDVEWQYINLINTTIHLFRRIPTICESEVIAIQDLLDMEQYEDLVDIEDPDDDVIEIK